MLSIFHCSVMMRGENLLKMKRRWGIENLSLEFAMFFFRINFVGIIISMLVILCIIYFCMKNLSMKCFRQFLGQMCSWEDPQGPDRVTISAPAQAPAKQSNLYPYINSLCFSFRISTTALWINCTAATQNTTTSNYYKDDNKVTKSK